MKASLDDAIAFAQAHEVAWPRDPAAPLRPGETPWGVHHDDPPPYNRLRGPVHSRGPQSGFLLRHGTAVAVLALVPIGALLPVPRSAAVWLQAVLLSLYASAIAAAACYLAWHS